MGKPLNRDFRSNRGLLSVLILAALLPPLIALRVQISNWINIPIWDEWDTPGIAILHWAQHKLTWADLIAQHNESRKVIPRLIGILLSLSGQWDVRRAMILTFLSYCTVSGAAFLFLHRCTRTLVGALAALLCVNLLLFAPSQYENLLSSYIYEFVIPVLCLFGAAAVNLSAAGFITKTLCCSTFALIGTYTFAHGMLLWPLLWPLADRSDWATRARTTRTLCLSFLYTAIGATSVLYYFAGYSRPTVAPEPAKLSQAADVLRFVSIYLGSVFEPIRLRPEFVGIFVLCSLGTVGLTTISILARRPEKWRCSYPWILLGLFSGGSALLTAIGRLNIGTDLVFAETFYGFSAVRYNAAAVYFYIAVIGISAGLLARAGGSARIRRGRALLTIFSSVAVVFAWQAMYRNERPRLSQFRENRLRARVATIWARCLPENPELFAAYPYISGFSARVEEFRHARLFSLPTVSPELASTISHQPQATTLAGGWLDGAVLVDKTHVRVSGWARNATDNKAANLVIVGYERDGGSFQPFATVIVGKPRTDVATTTGNKYLRQSGFDQTIEASKLPSGRLVFRAWAIDVIHQRAFPLNGSAVIDVNEI